MVAPTYDERDASARVRRSNASWTSEGEHVERAGSSRRFLNGVDLGLNLSPRAPGDTAKLSAADFFVPSLPGLPNLAGHPTHPLNLYAGLIPSYPGPGNGGGVGRVGQEGKIFFMMARARRAAGKQRVIFWFNGGPGCSSFDGSLMEVGPFRTVPASQTTSGKTELKLVEGGWEEFATVVFIDQPPGTGLSTIPVEGYLTELTQASEHLIQFLQTFYQVFPELKQQDTYLAGESYAGQYIPYFTDALLKTNKLPSLNLVGIAIGNGWIDPLRQYPAYAEFAYTKGLIKKGTAAAEALDAELEKCKKAMEDYVNPLQTPINIGNCEGVMHKVTEPFKQEINGVKKCMNIYDVRLTDDDPQCGMNWPPDLSDVYSFLRRSDVVASLHATEHSAAWEECSGRVGLSLRNENSSAAVHFIPSILERGVKVMMFAGAEDLICNYVGIERMIEALHWHGETGFGVNSTTDNWSLNNTKVGEWTTDRNMTYVKVLDSSHMVGFDVPDVTNDMIMRFMDVDISLLPGWTGMATSKVGEDERPAVHFGNSKQAAGIPLLKGGHGDWESWYNAISAVLILCTLGGIVGVYLYFRSRKGKGGGAFGRLQLPMASERDRDREAEERVPLAAEDYELDVRPPSSMGMRDGGSEKHKRSSSYKGKGKQKMEDPDDESDAERGESHTVFALGDEEEHER